MRVHAVKYRVIHRIAQATHTTHTVLRDNVARHVPMGPALRAAHHLTQAPTVTRAHDPPGQARMCWPEQLAWGGGWVGGAILLCPAPVRSMSSPASSF